MQDAARSASHDMLPRGALLAIGALLFVSIAGTAAVRWSGVSIQQPDAAPASVRLLRFEDGADGSVLAVDAATGQAAARLTGEQGFLRGALRAMARERRRAGLGPEPPFELIGRADGRLTLADPATGQRIDLESFGPSNAAVFARLLERPRQP